VIKGPVERKIGIEAEKGTYSALVSSSRFLGQILSEYNLKGVQIIPSSVGSFTSGSFMKPTQKRPLESTDPSLPRMRSGFPSAISSSDQTFLIQR
jgi:hypothetical protein